MELNGHHFTDLCSYYLCLFSPGHLSFSRSCRCNQAYDEETACDGMEGLGFSIGNNASVLRKTSVYLRWISI